MQATESLKPRRATHPRTDPRIEENGLLAREFAHDRAAVWLLALDTAIRRAARAVAFLVRN